MIHVDGSFRTDDLALASVIVMHGYEPKMRRDDPKGKVNWCLPRGSVDGDLRSLVADYTTGELEVEPQEFLKMVWLVRRRMYDFMGIRHDGPRGQRVRTKPSR